MHSLRGRLAQTELGVGIETLIKQHLGLRPPFMFEKGDRLQPHMWLPGKTSKGRYGLVIWAYWSPVQ